MKMPHGVVPLSHFRAFKGRMLSAEVVSVGPDGDASLSGKQVMIDTWLRDWSDPTNRDKCG